MDSDRFYLFKEMETERVLLLRLRDETGIRKSDLIRFAQNQTFRTRDANQVMGHTFQT